MAEIVLFPSVLGVRAAIRDAEARFEAAGHVVHVVDLYGDGLTFDDYPAAFAHLTELGGPAELMKRTEAAAAALPADVMYVGFSAGGACAELLALTRPGARGLLLAHAAMAIEHFGVDAWPADVPVQVHYAQHDPFREQDELDALAASVRAAGAPFEFYEYPLTGHLFTDPGLPDEYDEAATTLWYARALRFLGQ